MDRHGDRGDGEDSACRSPVAARTVSFDAQSVDAALDGLVFDSALSFLDNLDDLNDSVELLLNDSTNGAVGSVAQLKKEELPLRSTESHNDDQVQPAPTARTTRERQKQEMEYLRSQVVALEGELAELKASSGSSSSALVATSVWEKLANRQNEAKQKAMIENARLRGLLEGQLKVARSLEKLLNKRSLCETNEGFSDRKRLRITDAEDVNAILEEIRSRIHLQFDDLDTVMQECGLSVIYTDLDDAQAMERATTNGAICLEVTVAKVLPFSVPLVADAVWQCLSTNQVHLRNGFISASRCTELTMDLEVAVKVKLRRAEAVIHVRGVGARLTEADRSLMVFEAAGTTEGALFADDPIHCRERGYILIEKNIMAPDSSVSPTTIVKSCVHLWPEHASSGGEQTTGTYHLGSFIDLVIGSYNENTKTMFQLVENILLEQALTSSTPSSEGAT